MKNAISKIVLTAILGFALAFVFGCKEKSENKSSSSSEGVSSSSEAIFLPIDEINQVEQGDQISDNSGCSNNEFCIDLIGSFGFSDGKGERIIIHGENTNGLDIAIGYGGKIAEINFLGMQKGTDENNLRDTEQNFKNLPGYIFNKTKGNLKSGTTYFLTNQSFKQLMIPLVSTKTNEHKYASVDTETIKIIEEKKNRKIVASQLLAKTASDAKICLITFERLDHDMLASLVYIDGDKAIYDDYPAEYDENSVWRVDDKGILGGFDVLFLANAPEGKGLLLGFTSSGPEGENAYIVMEKEGAFVHTQYHNYRYWAPD